MQHKALRGRDRRLATQGPSGYSILLGGLIKFTIPQMGHFPLRLVLNAPTAARTHLRYPRVVCGYTRRLGHRGSGGGGVLAAVRNPCSVAGDDGLEALEHFVQVGRVRRPAPVRLPCVWSGPLPSEEATTQEVVRTFTSRTRPESGLDCLICAIFVRRPAPVGL